MYEYFDTVPDRHNVSKEYDVSYSMGVLTTVVSKEIGKFMLSFFKVTVIFKEQKLQYLWNKKSNPDCFQERMW